MIYLLRQFHDPILSVVCDALKPGDDLSFIPVMQRFCRDNNGVGLAAPQIGLARRAIFIMPSGRGRCWSMINPKIVHASKETSLGFEGCLSYPGLLEPFKVEIERHTFITVDYFDLNWKKRTGNYVNWEARIVQHEIDHLDGICKVGDAWKVAHESDLRYVESRRKALVEGGAI
jgi:peptide deformylase